VTYREVGATRDSELPSGYRHDRHSVALGSQSGAFDLGREAIRQWRAHRSAGAELVPQVPPLEPGTVLAVSMRTGPIWVTAPCRIVYVTDESDRFGFGYGTLPGHPERGEESFHVARKGNGSVTFDIVAFSRPADLLARLGAPITRKVQNDVTNRYLLGLRGCVVGAE